MRFVILGATGPTGQALVNVCLEAGHHVKALVRNPTKLVTKHDCLAVEKVDIFKEEELVPHFRETDAILSCLGSPAVFWQHCSLYTDSVKPITAAMREAGVTRLVLMSASGCKDDPDLKWYVRYIFKPIVLRSTLANIAQMEDILEEQCQDLDFTIVRAPGLTNSATSGKEIHTSDRQFVPDGSLSMPRQDVAKFMLTCVTEGTWLKKCVAIAIK